MTRRRQLAREALRLAHGVRRRQNLPRSGPISAFDLASDLGLEVLFQDLRGFEGLYLPQSRPVILVSAQRPPSRQAYTCAHEVGHHIAGHGMAVDSIATGADGGMLADEEFLVEAFAGFLLMPHRGVVEAFRERDVEPTTCSPEVFYGIAAALGVGYTTLVHHAFWSLGLIDGSRFRSLLKVKPKEVKSHLLGRPFTGGVIIVDEYWPDRPVDLRVDDLILNPQVHLGEQSVVRSEGKAGDRFVLRGRVPGVGKVELAGRPRVVRVSRRGYMGRAVNRFWEDPDFE